MVRATTSRIKVLMWGLLFIFVLSNLMVQAFVTVTPLITESFAISASTASIQVTITTVTLGVASMIYDTLTDYISIKKLMVVGICLLAIGSVIGFAFQHYYWAIVLARAIQTAGQAAMGELFVITVSRYLSEEEKLRYMAIYTAAFQLAYALGVLMGSIVTAHIPWYVLLLLPLISLVLLPIAWQFSPEEEVHKKERIDVFGITLFSLVIVFLILYLNQMQILFLISFGVLLVAFLLYIHYQPKAFITGQFFKENKRFATAWVMVALLEFTQFSFAFLVSFVVTDGFKASLAHVSSVMLPAYLVAIVAGLSGPAIIKLIGEFKTMLLGSVMAMVGTLTAASLIQSGLFTLSIGAILFISGLNILFTPMMNMVIGSLRPESIGRGIGLNDLTINITGSIGLAIVGLLMSSSSFKKTAMITNTTLGVFQNIYYLMAVALMFAIVVLILNRKKLFPEE
ncbi:MFS transporter [Levilactobacillus huananensis]|uniref:MFS transporter n=1 Tax=Levilactobacillus huananensis TaxID=2486019 RepID=UPI000F771BAB|nr:MFS transporter [Levilactobacillus huananensis]